MTRLFKLGILTPMLSIMSLAGGAAGRLMLTGVIFATAIAAVVTTSTGALFTDNDSVAANTFVTGTVILTALPTSALISFDPMAPGDVDHGQMTVKNDGSLQLRYSVSSSTTGSEILAAQLAMTVWDEAAESAGDGICETSAPSTVLYGPAALGSTAGINLIGNPTQGAQTGDRVLSAATDEILCFRVELPLGSDNSYQGLTTTSILTLNSEQTQNN